MPEHILCSEDCPCEKVNKKLWPADQQARLSEFDFTGKITSFEECWDHVQPGRRLESSQPSFLDLPDKYSYTNELYQKNEKEL